MWFLGNQIRRIIERRGVKKGVDINGSEAKLYAEKLSLSVATITLVAGTGNVKFNRLDAWEVFAKPIEKRTSTHGSQCLPFS